MLRHSPSRLLMGLLTVWVVSFTVILMQSAAAAVGQASPEGLNYGFFMVRSQEQLEDVPPLNASWVRMGGVALWNLIEPVPGSGNYSFSATDAVIQEAADRDITLLLSISQRNDRDPGASIKALPTDMQAYKAFVTAIVERYDGDGVDDAPSSPVVRYWQVGNEPDNLDENGQPIEWNDTPQNYALFLKESAQAIRQADPTAIILIGGLARGMRGLRDFYEPMFAALDEYEGGPFFDVFDAHWFGKSSTNDYVGLESVMPEINNLLAAHGLYNMPVWVTETATYSGSPEEWPAQTEEDQARDVAKRLIYYRFLGAPKIFWVPLTEFHDWKGQPNGYFDNTGLINNPLNDGDASRKKGYYTYRLLASKLDGASIPADSTFNQLMASSGFQGCEFVKDGSTYYGLWVDSPALAGTVISYPTDYEAFTVYNLVPKANGNIPAEIVQTVNGRFKYTVGLDPILVEYCGDPVDEDEDHMSRCWEEMYAPALDPSVDDADLDADGDGYRNIIEYAAGSDPTDENSLPIYVEEQSLTTTSTTDFNMVCLCLEDTGLATASELCASIAGCQVVSRWVASRQGYDDYIIGLPFTDFPLELGKCYFVGVTEGSTFNPQGIIPNSIAFELITTPTTDYNFISLPFGMPAITTASELCALIPGCQVASKWIASRQGYDDYIVGFPFTDFPVEPCAGYFIGTTTGSIWP